MPIRDGGDRSDDQSFPNPTAGFWTILYPYRRQLTAVAIIVIPFVVVVDLIW